MAATQNHYDVVIVGAGVHGLCAAHTFLSIEPSLTLLVVDSKSTVGGVWAKEQQLYPGLRANNLQGYYDFSDFPMLDAGLGDLGVRERGMITGEAVHAYVQEYAKHFDLLRMIRSNTEVVRATNNATDPIKASTLEFADNVHASEYAERFITCSKLVVATGQTSQPWVPPFPGVELWKRPFIHSANLGKEGQFLVSDPSVAHVTVVGGSKSAYDAVYMFAMAGRKVTWLIRRTGRGGMPLVNSYTQMGPWKAWLEGLLMTRPLSWFGACPWSEGDGFGWIRRFLHNTAVGRWFVRSYFASMLTSSLDQSGILQDEMTKVLVPD